MPGETLLTVFPDVEVLLALEPEELAAVVLRIAKERQQNGQVHLQAIVSDSHGPSHDPNKGYPQARKGAVENALIEAWNWLKVNGLIVPSDTSTNGNNGWHRISRRGARLSSSAEFAAFRQAASFPKTLLHPSIAETVWLDLIRGDLDTAVFKSFKAVEEAVRKAGSYSATDIGVDLMREAFDSQNGPLTDKTQPIAEREALAHLFAAGIGSYKNPHSHRTVTISDPVEAREMVMLASHLLRIVDSRKP